VVPVKYSNPALMLILPFLAVSEACSNPLRKLEKENILKRMVSLNSFSGTYVETGVTSKPQETRILARRYPAAIFAQVTSEGPAKGSILHYAGDSISLYYPKSKFGIRYRHVPALSDAQQVAWIEQEYDWHLKNYDIDLLEDQTIAGFNTKNIVYSPNTEFSKSPFSYQWQAFVEPEYAFAVKTRMVRDGQEKYRIEFKNIEFQKPFTEKDLAFRFPAGATVAEYDMAGKNYSLKAANAGSNFRMTLPKTSEIFSLKKIIRVQGIIPAYTAYFENFPYQTYYTQVKDYGLNLVPPRGLVLEGHRKYRVNFAGAFKSVYFLEKGAYHTIVSSRPLSEVLSWLEEN
jgi:outer membrane lipoprotein-sorting protein